MYSRNTSKIYDYSPNEVINIPGTEGSLNPQFYKDLSHERIVRCINFWKKQKYPGKSPVKNRIEWLRGLL